MKCIFTLFLLMISICRSADRMDQRLPLSVDLLFIRPIDGKNKDGKIPVTHMQISAIMHRLLEKKVEFKLYLTYTQPGSDHMHTNIFIDKKETVCQIGRKDVPIDNKIFQPFQSITASDLSEHIGNNAYVIDFSIICSTDKAARSVAGAINHVIRHT